MTRHQRDHLFIWAIFLGAAELVLAVAPVQPVVFFIAASAAFSAGFALRFAGVYPGKDEPAALDFLSAVFAVVAAGASVRCGRPVLFALPVLVACPHFVYIVLTPEIGASGWFTLTKRRHGRNKKCAPR